MPLQTVEPQRLYRQIADQLRALIAQGEFAVGARLPAERDLAKQLGVSRQSVCEGMNRAFQRLDQYEQTLGLSARFQVIQKGLKDSLGCLKQIRLSGDEQANILKAEHILQKLLDEEDT